MEPSYLVPSDLLRAPPTEYSRKKSGKFHARVLYHAKVSDKPKKENFQINTCTT